jgi:2-oxoglutarate dehydrogenase E1 component
VFTPKSLLRHPRATSNFDEVAQGRFRRVIADEVSPGGADTSRVLLCTGKVYYELEKHREDLERNDVAILRIEQLYPLPKRSLAMTLEKYAPGTPLVWVQDEPENMGAWAFIRMNLGNRAFGRFPLSRVSRARSASPATGSASSHRIEQQELIDAAFGVT